MSCYKAQNYNRQSVIIILLPRIKIEKHSSCDIKDFVGTHLCKLCVIYNI